MQTQAEQDLQKQKTFAIPNEVASATGATEAPREKTITEQLEEKHRGNMDKFKWIAMINVDKFMYLDGTLRNEQDFEKGNWHYIPRTINPEYRHEHEGKKVCLEIYCINDKGSQRRLKKIINRYCPGRKVNWEQYSA